jgi:hypothetical protein
MKFLLPAILFSIPFIASADNGDGSFIIMFLAFFGAPLFIVFIAFLIPVFFLYILRHKSNSLLLFVDIVFSVFYVFIINYKLPAFDVQEMLGFPIFALIIFVVIFGIVLIIKKILGKDILSLRRVFLHGIITGIITIIFTISFAHGTERILYSTNCDTNLILNPGFRESSGYMCIQKTAIARSDSEFCNKASDSRHIDGCKLQVNISMVQSDNLLGCSYLKSHDDEVLFNEGTTHGQEILNKCESR